MSPMVTCYNKGCGKEFNIDDNGPDSCIYHPGPPIFHDALKIWKCCDKKSCDFGTWLSYPGCTKGPHSAEKPVDAVKLSSNQAIRPEPKDQVIQWSGLNKPAERNMEGKEFVLLNIEPTSGLLKAIDLEKSKIKEGESGDVVVGSACRNSGCTMTYSGPEANATICLHHPGTAVFHEGMKYWSCCERKTSNFQSFLEQEGCTRGDHCWKKNEKVNNIRHDWFSRFGFIHVNLYCKGALPSSCKIKSNGLLLECDISYEFGDKEAVLSYELFGEIIPSESKVNMSERKIEIVLKQLNEITWPRLCYQA
ncbi:Cysteine/histidine-rich domain and CS domain and HSP20-like chaperone domain-containing protein [Strongyloides ratti]|uniref:Cysteine/histidine-rich domain and CS domain and HSP20-like chaperone domain-containing protein n=1 Tax=Strongyloides ratti TaxID=34506 RepID=A0A090L5I0_STRRB|nr:Cysteine/histidine-rich domain and CS domain and HSP20-like chaperone domain-containing protein [Strongyloides ratti]CEF62709.1 Cysteine/histidine-rich domain and CS domain and HSP20-like chaperone domain-containing protein [Strongyloides ratti]